MSRGETTHQERAEHRRAEDKRLRRWYGHKPWRLEMLVGFFLVLALIGARDLANDVSVVEDLRGACVRDGARAEVQYDAYYWAKELAKEQKREDLVSVYSELRQRLRSAVRGYPVLDGHDVRVDCAIVNEYPWPVRVLRD